MSSKKNDCFDISTFPGHRALAEVAEWLAHWLLVLEVPGSIPAGGEENLLVRTRFPSCHLQE